jgi:ADP-ribose pyrophosphatase YjhB (NUDIX family)
MEEVKFCLACGAEMEIKIAFGRLRPVCPACGRVHFRDPKVAAAVLVEKDGKVLLVQRGNVPQQGKWTLPAGFVDINEDPKIAAARECFEETGLHVEITGLMDVIFGREHERGASIVIVYLGQIQAGELQAGDDATDVGFFSPGELPPIAFKATVQALSAWRDGR